jgi:hypothetical protein
MNHPMQVYATLCMDFPMIFVRSMHIVTTYTLAFIIYNYICIYIYLYIFIYTTTATNATNATTEGNAANAAHETNATKEAHAMQTSAKEC